jgi:hypothetical protein
MRRTEHLHARLLSGGLDHPNRGLDQLMHVRDLDTLSSFWMEIANFDSLRLQAACRWDWEAR